MSGPVFESDVVVYEGLAFLLALSAWSWSLLWLSRRFCRSRPGLQLAKIALAALLARVSVAVLVSALPNSETLRGPDDGGFFSQGMSMGDLSPFASDWLEQLSGRAHVVFIGVQASVLGAPGDLALRVTQISLAVAGILFMVAAVYDMAGPRAAMIAGWLLAFEPSHLFFSGLFHKESLVLLAEGIAALAAVRMWIRRDAVAWALLATSVMVAMSVRPYAAILMLGGAGLLTSIHAHLRRLAPMKPRNIPAALAIAACALLVVTPIALGGREELSHLQRSMNVQARNNANLALSPVDFSSPTSALANFPGRAADFLFRPYPWQIQNSSQRAAVPGTLVAWAVLLIALIGCLLTARTVLPRAAPVLYLLGTTLIIYAFTTGNAGTGYRHRVHVVFFGIALVAVVVDSFGRRSATGASQQPVVSL